MFSIFMECFKRSIISQKHILWSAVCTFREFLMEYNLGYFASIAALQLVPPQSWSSLVILGLMHTYAPFKGEKKTTLWWFLLC